MSNESCNECLYFLAGYVFVSVSYSVYCLLHGFVTAGLSLVPFTWPYVLYLGSIYYW